MTAFKVEQSVDQKDAEDGNGSVAPLRSVDELTFERPLMLVGVAS
jgi:hypothetical protein